MESNIEEILLLKEEIALLKEEIELNKLENEETLLTDAEFFIKEIERLEEELKKETILHKETEDELFLQNFQKTRLLEINNREKESLTKSILFYEVAIQNLKEEYENKLKNETTYDKERENELFLQKTRLLEISNRENESYIKRILFYEVQIQNLHQEYENKLKNIEEAHINEIQAVKSEQATIENQFHVNLQGISLELSQLKEENLTLNEEINKLKEKYENISNINSPLIKEKRLSIINYNEDEENKDNSNDNIEKDNPKPLILIKNEGQNSPKKDNDRKESNSQDYYNLLEVYERKCENLEKDWISLNENYKELEAQNKEEIKRNYENIEKIEILTKELNEMKEEIQRNKRDFIRETEAKMDYMRQLTDFESFDITELSYIIEFIEPNYEGNENERALLDLKEEREKVDALVKEKKEINRIYRQEAKEKRSLEEDCAKKEKEIQALQQEKEILEKKFRVFDDFEKENKDSKGEIKVINVEITKENEDSKGEIKVINVENQDLEEITKENKLLKARIDQINREKKDLEEITKENRDLKATIDQIIKENKDLEEITKENKLLKARIDQINKNLEEITKENKLLKDKIDQIYRENKDLEEITKENMLLKEKIEVINREKKDLEEIIKENKDLKDKIVLNKENKELVEITNENKLLKTKIDQINRENKELVEITNENKLLKTKIDQINRENKNLEEITKENKLLKAKIDQINREKKDLVEITKENNLLKTQIEEESNKDKIKIEGITKENNLLKTQIEEIMKENAKLKLSKHILDEKLIKQEERLSEKFLKIQTLSEANLKSDELIKNELKGSLLKESLEKAQENDMLLKAIEVLTENNEALEKKSALLTKENSSLLLEKEALLEPLNKALKREETLSIKLKTKENEYKEELSKNNLKILDLTDKFNDLQRIFQQEMKEKALEEAQFIKKLINLNQLEILRKNEISYKEEIEGLKKREIHYKELLEKKSQESDILKMKETSIKEALLLISRYYTQNLMKIESKITKKQAFLTSKLKIITSNFTLIKPLLSYTSAHLLNTPLNKEKSLNIFLLEALIAKNQLEKRTFGEESERERLLKGMRDVLQGNAAFIRTNTVFHLIEGNFLNSWKVFELLQEVFSCFKGIIVENNLESGFSKGIRMIYERFIEFLKEKHSDFKENYKRYSSLSKGNELEKAYELHSSLLEGILERKADLRELTRLIQKHIDFSVKLQVENGIKHIFDEKLNKNKE